MALALATISPAGLKSSASIKQIDFPHLSIFALASARPGKSGRRKDTFISRVGAFIVTFEAMIAHVLVASSSMAARNPPWIAPLGLAKAGEASNSIVICMFTWSTAIRRMPSVSEQAGRFFEF